jgi:parallel beta-helix repeat protein
MNRKVTLIVFVSFFVLVTLGTQLIVTVAAGPRTIYVDAGNTGFEDGSKEYPYNTIQEGINAANLGDIIQVRTGTYNESIIINKSGLMLIGESRENTIIDGGGRQFVVYVGANNVTFSGFTIRNGEEYGIWLYRSSNNNFTGNIVLNNQYGIYLERSNNNSFSYNAVLGNNYGIYVYYSSHNVLSSNIASRNNDGIYLEGSSYDNLSENTVTSNNRYGIFIYHSSNIVISGNTALNNTYGIYASGSNNNALSGNIASNNDYGIYFHYSDGNIVSGNAASNNNEYGVHFWGSSNNVLSGNAASNNSRGIYLWGSNNNVLSGNIASNNSYGIYFYYSSNNVISGNAASNNGYGIYLWSSSNNIIFHNNFINNAEPLNSIGSVNSWDNDAEGNYWSDYDGADADRDGIGDTPYTIDGNNQDNYPLMAMLLQFNIATEGVSYKINVVSNSTISNFQCRYDVYNRVSGISFKVNGAKGKGFCRISIPHALIEPPYIVVVDEKPPSYSKIVHTNGTHTWLYFAYEHSEHEVIIMHKSSPGLAFLSQWAILGLTATVVILLSISIHYYRLFREQKKVIQAYERELGSFPVSHSERARVHFIKDVIERKEKIEKFKKKYGVKVYPASTLDELVEKLGIQKEKGKAKR